MRRRRPASLFARLLGIALMLPGMLQVPLPQIDFHVIRHLHGNGEVCPKHDHLLRWHPQAGEGQDVAVLHWHWLLPHSDEAIPDAAGRSIPVLHAHDGDQDRPDPGSGPIVVRETSGAECRGAIGSSLAFAQPLACWLAPLPRPLPDLSHSFHRAADGPSPDAALSRLVRRNC